jgi:hypothetical protein
MSFGVMDKGQVITADIVPLLDVLDIMRMQACMTSRYTLGMSPKLGTLLFMVFCIYRIYIAVFS